MCTNLVDDSIGIKPLFQSLPTSSHVKSTTCEMHRKSQNLCLSSANTLIEKKWARAHQNRATQSNLETSVIP